MKTKRRSKIVVTIGPATDSEEKIKELIKAGANVFRFNTSHGSSDYHKEKIRLVKKVADEMKVFVATLVDLQGPKIRIGVLDNEIPLEKGQEIILEHYSGEKKKILFPLIIKALQMTLKQAKSFLLMTAKFN